MNKVVYEEMRKRISQKYLDENERLIGEYGELYHEMSIPAKSVSIISTELNILNEMYYDDSLKNMKADIESAIKKTCNPRRCTSTFR